MTPPPFLHSYTPDPPDSSLFFRVQSVKENVFSASPSLIFIANKIDLTESRKVTTQEGKELADTLGALYCETSVKENRNIVETIDLLLDSMLKGIKPPPEEKSETSNEEEEEEEPMPEEGMVLAEENDEEPIPKESTKDVTKLPVLGSAQNSYHAHDMCYC